MSATARSDDGRREALVLGIARGLTVTAAARRAGVSRRAAHLWLREPAVRARVAETRAALFSHAVGRLAGLSARAVATLRRNLRCGDAAVEVRAALGALTQAHKAMELAELQARVEA